MSLLDTIVVGAGQAGLAMSFHLRRQGREHLVLERARVAERWRTQRWDSLMFQSPNWSLELPGMAYEGDDPDGFSHKDQVLGFIERYCARIEAPVLTSAAVRALRRRGHDGPFEVATERGVFEAQRVVVATGPYQVPWRPALAAGVPAGVLQLHASAYRNPGQLPAGAVLIVGSGASGCQIGDELLEAGRRVLLCVGRHRRVPRRYRGRDVFWWRRTLGELDQPAESTPRSLRAPGPLLTGVHGGYDVDLRRAARRGMTLLGRLEAIDGTRLAFADDLVENLRQGDLHEAAFRARADAHAARAGLELPEPPTVPQPQAWPPGISPRTLDLRAEGVGSILWATGYRFDFGWIDLPVLDHDGAPVQRRGVTAVPGLYFLGLPWMSSAKSSFLFGVGEDAAHLAAVMEGQP
jgi:putative flavoprotein involved in K+ transport